MKKLFISILIILLFLIMFIVYGKLTNKSKINDDLSLSYYISNMSYVKSEQANVILFEIVNSSLNDAEISNFSYKIYDKDDNLQKSGELNYKTEFLSKHSYLIQLEVDDFDFSKIIFKPLYDDKTEIPYLDNKFKLEYEQINNIEYTLDDGEYNIDITLDQDVELTEIKVAICNSIDNEIILYYQPVNKKINAGQKYKLKSVKNDSAFLSTSNVKVYYR